MCRSGRNIPSADGWCRKRRKKEGRKKERKKMVEEFPVIWRADGFVHVRAAADLFQPRRKKNVCRVNFDLFRFSLTLQLVITCRTELPTTPIMLWWLLCRPATKGIRVWRQVEGISAFINKSSRVANAIRFLHRIFWEHFRVLIECRPKRSTHTLYRGIISAAGNDDQMLTGPDSRKLFMTLLL